MRASELVNDGVEPTNHSVVGMCMMYECVCIGAEVGCSVCNDCVGGVGSRPSCSPSCQRWRRERVKEGD